MDARNCYQQSLGSARAYDRTYGAIDGAIVGGGALGGDGDTVGGLELDLKDRCRIASVGGQKQESIVAGHTSSGMVEILVQELWHTGSALGEQTGLANCARTARNADVRRWPTWGCR